MRAGQHRVPRIEGSVEIKQQCVVPVQQQCAVTGGRLGGDCRQHVRVLGEQFLKGVLGVGHVIDVGGGSVLIPGEGVGTTAGGELSGRVGTEQSGRLGAGAAGSKVFPAEALDRRFRLSEVDVGAGRDDGEFDGGLTGQRLPVGAVGQFDRAVGPSETALAVCDQWKQRLAVTGNASRGLQFADGFLPLPGVVGGDAVGLSDHTDSGGPGAGGPGVLESEFGVFGEGVAGGDEVPGDTVCGVLVEPLKFAANVRVEI